MDYRKCECGELVREALTTCPKCGRDTTSRPQLASTGQRFRTFLLDILFLNVFAVAVGFMSAALGLLNVWLGISGFLLGAIVSLIYFVGQEAVSGRTIGKLITGTTAVNEDGTKLTFGRALGRTLCRFIPFEAFSFFGGNGGPRGWHDRIPKTKVISVGKPWTGFGLGVLSTVVVGIAGLIAFGIFYTGPMLAISVQLPEEVVLGDEFSLTVDVSNPHNEDVVLSNLDIPNRFFETFEIVLISPAASEESPFGDFRTQTWYFFRELNPGSSFQIIVNLKALKSGIHPVEFDVCNYYQQCTTFVGVIEVRDK